MTMKKIALLFPGQGSQSVGMGRHAAARSAAAQSLFNQADIQLGFALSSLCFEGPEEELKRTETTQPALFAASAATLAVLADAGIRPWAVAGHSLGEYTALYAAGTFTYAEGLALVRTRGLAYADAGSKRPGAMAAILGLDVPVVREICAAASTGGKIVVAANINDPVQVVISGDPEAVTVACEAAKARGAKRALVLPVSGAFHSPLVESAAVTMEQALADVTFKIPDCLFVNNVDATPQIDPQAIKRSLVRQITGSVRWVETIEHLVAEGAEIFIEVGSGKVLAGLVKRIRKDAICLTTENAAAMDATLAAVNAA